MLKFEITYHCKRAMRIISLKKMICNTYLKQKIIKNNISDKFLTFLECWYNLKIILKKKIDKVYNFKEFWENVNCKL